MNLPPILSVHLVPPLDVGPSAGEAVLPDEAICAIDVQADLPAFCGHFPAYPVLPGVVQIDWAVRLAAAYLGTDRLSPRDIQVKFRNIIRPGQPLSLRLKIDRFRQRLSFTYQSGEQIMALGQIRLGAKL
ncbi:MAG: hypothetical protein M3N08_04280 [Pseudomonadota bacterium]|nr:hypothetical protein [Pseudomonadota bacterium]